MLWIWGPCSFTILTWWLSGDGFRYIHHRPPQTYIFRGVDNVFFCGQNLYFSWDFHVYIYTKICVFSYFHTKSSGWGNENDMMRFYFRFASSWSLKKGLGFFHGKGLIGQTSGRRGAGREWHPSGGGVFSGGCNGEKLAIERIFSTKETQQRETIATGIPPTFIARLYPVDLLGGIRCM